MLVSNDTPLVAIAIGGNDVDRSECGTVIAKATLALRGHELVLDAKQDELQGGDAHYDDDFATKAFLAQPFEINAPGLLAKFEEHNLFGTRLVPYHFAPGHAHHVGLDAVVLRLGILNE